MRYKKFLDAGLVLAWAALSAAGCGTEPTTAAKTELDGQWRNDCIDLGGGFSSRTTLAFGADYLGLGNGVSQLEERFSGGNCPASALHTVLLWTGTYAIGSSSSAVSGGKEIDVSFTAVEAAPISAAALTAFNSTPYCSGKTNWTASAESLAGLTCNLNGAGSRAYSVPVAGYTVYVLDASAAVKQLRLGTGPDLSAAPAAASARSTSVDSVKTLKQL